MKTNMKRALSALLVIAMVLAMPVVSMADDGINIVCNHSTSASSSEVTQKVVDPTCTTAGYTTYTCTTCGYKFYGDFVPMNGHTYVETKVFDDGDVKYTCEDCGKTFTMPNEEAEGAGLGAHSHSFNNDSTSTRISSVFSASCSPKNYGYVKYTCNMPGCGYEQFEYLDDPMDHTWGEWEIVKAATVSSYGSAKRTCSGCGTVETVSTAKLSPSADQGRITKDLTPVYDSASGNNVVMYLAKGVTFNFANVKYGNRYEVESFQDVYGNTVNSGPYYVAIANVELNGGSIPVYTGYKGLQAIGTVKTDGSLNVRNGHSDTSAVIGSVNKGDTLYIYRNEASGWGRISATENKWVQLNGSDVSTIPVFGCGDELGDLSEADAPEKELADVGTVTAQVSTIVRDDANHSVGNLPKGTKINFYYIYNAATGKNESPFTWEGKKITRGYIDVEEATRLGLTGAGYIDMSYVALASGASTGNTSGSASSSNTVIATGVVSSSINLNVRKAPEVSILNLLGSIPTGTTLEFYEIGDHNGASWGRIKYNGKDGWVCMTYVQITSGSAGSSNSSTPNAKVNGTVVNCSVGVNVRDAADISGKLLGTIALNSRVAVTKLENGWGFVSGKGWVYMQYVKLDAGAEEEIKSGKLDGTNTGSSSTGTPVKTYTDVTVVGKVDSGAEATVYASALEKPGTELITMVEGREFTITDRTVINDTVWYKTSVGSYTGWVKGSNVTLPAISGTVAVNTLNVYEAASLDSNRKTSLVLNTSVTIKEDGQTTDGIYVWGELTTGGYVQMNNLKLTIQISGGNYGTSVGKTPITGKTNAATDVFEKPDEASKKLVKLSKKQSVSVDTWYSADGTTWGKVTVGEETGWINLANVNQDSVEATVNVDLLELYTEAGVLGTKTVLVKRNNDKLVVMERCLIGSTVWGRIAVKDAGGESDYWVNLAGTTLGTYSTSTTTPSTGSTGTTGNTGTTGSNGTTGTTGTTTTATKGTVVNTDSLNVRVNAGVSNALATTLKRGTVVTVYEQKTVDNALWGRIDQGWVAMSYIDLSAAGNNASSGVTSGSLAGNTILTSVPAGAVAVGFTNSKNLNVRNGAGYGYTVTGSLPMYTNVVIYEQQLVDGSIWGRTDKGWVCTSYVTLTGLSVTGTGTAGTVARCYYTARVRSNPGVGNAVVGNIMVNSRLEIYEQQSYSGEMWGRTSIGWIAMTYVLADGETIPV